MAWGFDREGDQNLMQLAESTGGRVEYPLQDVYSDVQGWLSKPQDAGNYALTVGTGSYAAQIANKVIATVVAVAGEISTQYVIRYHPADTDADKLFRKIKVEVALPDVTVRARDGYYPFPP